MSYKKSNMLPKLLVGTIVAAFLVGVAAPTVVANEARKTLVQSSAEQVQTLDMTLGGQPEPGDDFELWNEQTAQSAPAADSFGADSNCPAPKAGETKTCVKKTAPDLQQLTKDVQNQAVQASRRSVAVQGVAILPLPQWCIDNALNGRFATRTQQCEIFGQQTDLVEIVNGKIAVVGTLKANVYSYQYMSASSTKFAHQLQISTHTRTGKTDLVKISGGGSCKNACTVTSSGNFGPTFIVKDKFEGGVLEVAANTLAQGSTSLPETKWQLDWTTPNGAGNPVTTTPMSIRCDNRWGNRVAGCVVPYAVPTFTYSKTGPYPELANHIANAQASGLPGGSAAKPLTRTANEGVIAANRDYSCGKPPSVPGKSCDEYPFASTHQGAIFSNGAARTFPNCGFSDPQTTGPNGFSRCMILAGQNSGGGAVLGAFYGQMRVADGDDFIMAIVN